MSLQGLQSGITKWDYKVSLRVNNDVGGPPKVREYVNRIRTESMEWVEHEYEKNPSRRVLINWIPR